MQKSSNLYFIKVVLHLAVVPHAFISKHCIGRCILSIPFPSISFTVKVLYS